MRLKKNNYCIIYPTLIICCKIFDLGELCDLENQQCITLAMQKAYPVIVAGNADLGFEPSDTLKKDEIVAYLPTLNYTLSDLTMQGYSNCMVREARFRIAESAWHIFLDCPLLEVNMNYKLDGYIASERLLGEGKSKIIFKSYEISVNGGLEKEIRDDKIYIQLNHYAVTRLEVTDNINFSFDNLLYNDEEKTKKMNKFINDHWQELNSLAQQPAMQAIIGVMIDRFNQYFKRVPIDEIFIKM
ncbi:hypothetical protein K1T71_012551 [Dendrolimus kikuchii]|uniref:Uncharacterized protein n=1 Tax=Dendrolimus kikuchii TaxID=765133 RepID=A0ACC1CJN2_9NEOP|nr:hypothetical protein K1T71_012551 [Dendrolimus kikuchii]